MNNEEIIEKEYIFHSTLPEIGLGFINRLYKRNSKNRIRMNLTIVSSRGYRDNLLPKNKIFLTIRYFLPINKSEEQTLNSFFKKINKLGKLEELII